MAGTLVPSAAITSPVERRSLVRLAAELSGTDEGRAAEVAAMLLRSPRATAHLGARSTLNNDGTPLQICATLQESGCAVRLIGDPGAWARSIGERLAVGREALEEVFGQSDLATSCRRMLALALPSPLTDHPEAINGILWLASTVNGSGQALYVKARWSDPRQDWVRLESIAREILSEPREALRTIHALSAAARPVSVGLETAGAGRSRLKFYWRLERAVLIGALGIGPLGDDAIAGFLRRVAGTQPVRPSGLVFSSSFSLVSGRLSDVKVDVCAHCVRHSGREWLDSIGALAREHRFVAPRLREALRDQRSEVAFVGIGIGAKGERRLNLYLKEPASPEPARGEYGDARSPARTPDHDALAC